MFVKCNKTYIILFNIDLCRKKEFFFKLKPFKIAIMHKNKNI